MKSLFKSVSAVAVIVVSVAGIASACNHTVEPKKIESTVSVDHSKERIDAEKNYEKIVNELKNYGVLSVDVDNPDHINGNADNVVMMEVSEDIKVFDTYGNAIECDVTDNAKYVKNCLLSGKSFADNVVSGKFEGWSIYPTQKSDHTVICNFNKTEGFNLDKALDSGLKNCGYVNDTSSGMSLSEKIKTKIPTPITENYLNAVIKAYKSKN